MSVRVRVRVRVGVRVRARARARVRVRARVRARARLRLRARLLLGLLLLVVRGDDAARLLRVLADLAACRDHGGAALRATARQGAAAWLGSGLRVRVEG